LAREELPARDGRPELRAKVPPLKAAGVPPLRGAAAGTAAGTAADVDGLRDHALAGFCSWGRRRRSRVDHTRRSGPWHRRIGDRRRRQADLKSLTGGPRTLPRAAGMHSIGSIYCYYYYYLISS
ncbi:MAG: hypothetical protein AAFX06_34465, partial [Planctomycetota bacterium]